MDIYEPREDSYLLEACVKEYACGECLDMGTGSGILAMAADKCSKVLAVDINERALGLLYRRGIKGVELRHSDLFSAVSERFDTIIFNPPYLPDEPKAPDIALDGGPKGYELILRFLSEVKDHLNPGGHVLLLFSSRSHPRIIEKYLNDHNFLYEKIASARLDFEELFVYRISVNEVIARGKRGQIRLSRYHDKIICVKEEHKKETVGRLEIEAQFLRRLNKKGIGPEVYYYKDGLLGMEYVEGILINDFLKKANAEQIKKVLLDVLEQCFVMDQMGINKMEMTNPYKHVIVRVKGLQHQSKLDQNNTLARRGLSFTYMTEARAEKLLSQGKSFKPVLIDFERCKPSKNPKNVSQFIQYLNSTNVQAFLKGRLTIGVRDAREYKKDLSKKAFEKLKSRLFVPEFNMRIYDILKRVPKGRVTTYKLLAEKAGTNAYRAVGTAMNKNPFSPEVPCHRVVNSDGSIGGFASGAKNKIKMLAKEGVIVEDGKIVGFKRLVWA